MMDTSLSKPIECITPRVSRNVNCVLGVTMMCQCKSSIVTNVPLGVGDFLMGEAMYAWGQRYVGNLYLPLNFAVNLKLL